MATTKTLRARVQFEADEGTQEMTVSFFVSVGEVLDVYEVASARFQAIMGAAVPHHIQSIS